MTNSVHSQDFRLSLIETVWLEAEHFSLAQKISSSLTANPLYSWQAYLNSLALLGFEEWLRERLSAIVISRDTSVIETAGYLKLDKFIFCAIATEHLLDEVTSIPQAVVEQPELAAHFYVLLEVLEEEEEVIVRGFLPYHQLIGLKNNLKLFIDEGYYQIPLSTFDMEPNHLLTYQHYVEVSEFALPVADNIITQVSDNLSELASKTTTKLSKWFEEVVDEAWQTIDSVTNPELNLAFSTRSVEKETKKAKVIDLGIDNGSKKVALVVNISPDKIVTISEKINVSVQLYPMSGEKFLPQNIKLILISKAGKILQEVTSRVQDNYIQLKPFKGEPGKRFSIQFNLGNMIFREQFEL